MTVKDAYDYLRLLMDEADDTFVTPPQVQQMLRLGEAKYRRLIGQIEPSILATSIVIQIPSGSTQYDLATGTPSCLGANPSAPRLQKLMSVRACDINSNDIYELEGAGTFQDQAINQSGPFLNSGRYRLEGTVLYVGMRPLKCRIVYVPVSQTDWTKIAPSDNAFIDDLEEWHDLIALYGWEQYHLRDVQGSATISPLVQQVASRTAELKAYLISGRDPGASDHVIAVQ